MVRSCGRATAPRRGPRSSETSARGKRRAPRAADGHGDWLYFVANDGAHGRELWRSDGTATGTTLVKDLRAGADSSGSSTLTRVGPVLLFVADDGTHGAEPWSSDGTEAGTRLVADLAPGATGSDARVLSLVGSSVYFRATNGTQGDELFTVPAASFGDCAPPTVVCASDVTAEATAASGARVSYAPAQGGDDSGTPPQLGYSLASGAVFPLGDSAVVVTATDAAGNTETCSFVVKVRDTTPPQVTCPPAQEVVASGDKGGAVEYGAAQATDAVSTVTLSYSPPSGSTLPVGQTSVELTASDASGNSASCSFPVRVVSQATEDASGCGCRTGSAAEATGWLVVSLAALLRRRRREASVRRAEPRSPLTRPLRPVLPDRGFVIHGRASRRPCWRAIALPSLHAAQVTFTDVQEKHHAKQSQPMDRNRGARPVGDGLWSAHGGRKRPGHHGRRLPGGGRTS
ncbi:ELWxxDGT repeat protein [Corallococcus sp. 4LFB]|uniref:ELWxxDGT repeat protein n=1 Tax=Corallococcus sp. 4LFB TaxID=3383249 RepID=UPI0039756B62